MEMIYLHSLSAALYLALVAFILAKRIKVNITLWFAVLATLFWLLLSIFNNYQQNFYIQNYSSWLLSLFGWMLFLQSAYLKIPAGERAKYTSVNLVNALMVISFVAQLIFPIVFSSASAGLLITSYTGFVMTITMVFYLENIVRMLKPEYRQFFKHMLFALTALSFVNLLSFYNLVAYGEANPISFYLSLIIHLPLPIFIGVSINRLSRIERGHFEHKDQGIQFFLVGAGSSLVIAGIMQFLEFYFSKVRSDFYQAFFLAFLISSIGVLVLSDSFRSTMSKYLRAFFYGDRNDYKKEWNKVSTISRDLSDIYCKTLSYYMDWFGSGSGKLMVLDGKMLKTMCSIGEDLIGDIDADLYRFQENRSKDEFLGMVDDLNPYFLIFLVCNDQLVGICAFSVQREQLIYPNTSTLHLLDTVSHEFAIRLSEVNQNQKIQRQEKLLAFNRTVAFLAHDLKNISAQQILAVQNFDQFKNDPEFLEDFNETINHTTKRLNDLISQLRYKSLNSNQETVSFNDLIQFVEAKARLSGNQIKLTVAGSSRSVSGAFSAEILTVVENLLRNAMEASQPEEAVLVTLNFENRLEITVKDSGVGMTQEFVDNQLFEPFSSGNKKNGLGIGMYHVKSILDSLNADVKVDSNPGFGTTFQIVIPK